jgi:hypothetical protein
VSGVRKGGVTQADWMAIYARQFEAIGYMPYQAECAALNAWEASADDAEPDETASADIAYMAEDGE